MLIGIETNWPVPLKRSASAGDRCRPGRVDIRHGRRRRVLRDRQNSFIGSRSNIAHADGDGVFGSVIAVAQHPGRGVGCPVCAFDRLAISIPLKSQLRVGDRFARGRGGVAPPERVIPAKRCRFALGRLCNGDHGALVNERPVILVANERRGSGVSCLADTKINRVRKFQIVHTHLNPVLSVGAAESSKPVSGALHTQPQVWQAGYSIGVVIDHPMLDRAAGRAVVIPPKTTGGILTAF